MKNIIIIIIKILSKIKFQALLIAIIIFIIKLPVHAQTPACTTTIPRAEGLVSAPQQSLSTKFGTSSGACIIDPKASFVPFKVPTYDDLKSIYYDQAKPSALIVKHAPLTGNKTQVDIPFDGTADHLYYITGDLNISGNNLGTRSGVVTVAGNLNISSDYTFGTSISGTVFLVKGDVNIFSSISRIDAVIISSGTICSAYDGVSCPLINVLTSSPLTINGSLISLNESAPIRFRRSLGASDATTPAEKINHQVKYLVLLKDLFSLTLQKWSEVTEVPSTAPTPISTPTPTPTPAPTVVPTPTPTPTPTSTPVPSKRVFLSSATYTGQLGGVSGADARCKTLADVSTVPGVSGKTWMAWLSDSTNSPSTRFTTKNNGPYIRTDGVNIASSWTDLTDGSLANPINVNESGTVVTTSPSAVWTNTNSAGAVFGGTSVNCTNWTTIFGSGQVGSSTAINGTWSSNATVACPGSYRLYCFEQ